MNSVDPILEACYKSFPFRPDIKASETVHAKAKLDDRIDYWMARLRALTEATESTL